MTQPSSFGALLKRYRLASTLTQEELAERASMSVRGISDLERGARRLPQAETLQRLITALSLSATDRHAFETAGGRPMRMAAGRRRVARSLVVMGDHATVPHNTNIPALVGRRAELELMINHLRGHGPPILFVAGDPGIGKTRLLQEIASLAAVDKICVLSGGCQRYGNQGPYAPLLEALERDIHRRRPAQLRAALQGCGWLVHLLPELAGYQNEPLPAWTLPPDQQRRLLFAAVTRFLTNTTGPAGTLLVLDDLQWAGPDALSLLFSLARYAADIPLRIIGAYRETEVHPHDSLATILADMAHAGLAAQLSLMPLGDDASGQLLDGIFHDMPPDVRMVLNTDDVRRGIVQRAGGIPFFLVSCAQELRLRFLTDAVIDLEHVPWDVRQSIQQRVAALPVSAQEILVMAAIIGRQVSYPFLCQVMGRSEDDILSGLEAARRLRLLVDNGDQGYQFSHDVIREVIEADVGITQRRVFHRRIAQSLERGDDPALIEQLVYHYAQSDNLHKAIQYMEMAGDHAQVQCANASAERYYHMALDRLVQAGLLPDAARVREKVGSILTTMARYDTALEMLEQAIDVYRHCDDQEGVRRATAQVGWVHAERGTPDQGIERLSPLLHSLDALDPIPQSSAALYIALARLYNGSGRFGDQLASAERGAELARSLHDDRLLAKAETLRGVALITLERLSDAIQVLENARQLAYALNDLDYLSRALNGLAVAAMYCGEIDRSKDYIAQALTVAEQLGDAVQIAFEYRNRGCIALFTGDWVQARQDFERSVALNRQIGSSWGFPAPLASLGLLSALEGHMEDASRYLDECQATAEQNNDQGLLWTARYALAERDLLMGQPHKARERMSPLLTHTTLEQVHDPILLKTLAWAYVATGDPDLALKVVRQAITCARAGNDCIGLANALHIEALALTQLGYGREATLVLEEGLTLVRGICYLHMEARLLRVYAQLAASQAEATKAETHLASALQILHQLGAHAEEESVHEQITKMRRFAFSQG